MLASNALITVFHVPLTELVSVIQHSVLLGLNITNQLSFVEKDVVLITAVFVQTMELVIHVQMDLV